MTGADAPRFTDASFVFFDDLAAHNRTDWFEANRQAFEMLIDAPFRHVLEALTVRFADEAVPLRGSEATCFPMERDARFTQDKTPYNLNRSALMTPSGRRTDAGPALYLQVTAGGGMVFCGFHAMAPISLDPMRRRILDRADRFDEVLVALGHGGYGLVRDEALDVMPGGFDRSADHRHADILKRMTLGVRQDLSKQDWTEGAVVEKAASMAHATMPLLAFFD